jgi:glycosyltransferase involved in cell wall biosynthesis
MAQRICPLTNVTVPVFNRHDETLETLAALKARTQSSFILTVVDNGSEADLRKELLRLHDEKLIDNLFILDKNYGVSCACNLGWRSIDAPFFMKVDNDIKPIADKWLESIYSTWGTYRYSSITGPVWNCAKPHNRLDTPHGTMWSMPVSMSGEGFIVGRKIHERIGYFSEDYGLYGEEDADYCLRCHHAGIRKFSYEASGLLERIDADGRKYVEYGSWKVAAHNRNVGGKQGEGIFPLNLFLYEQGLRALNVPLKYEVKSMRGPYVEMCENAAYGGFFDALSYCLELFNESGRKPDAGTVERMRIALDKARV